MSELKKEALILAAFGAFLISLYFIDIISKVGIIYLTQAVLLFFSLYRMISSRVSSPNLVLVVASVFTLKMADLCYYIVQYIFKSGTGSNLVFYFAALPFGAAFLINSIYLCRVIKPIGLHRLKEAAYLVVVILVVAANIHFLMIPLWKKIAIDGLSYGNLSHLISLLSATPMIILSYIVICKSDSLPHSIYAAGFLNIGLLDWGIQLETIHNDDLDFSYYDLMWYFGSVAVFRGMAYPDALLRRQISVYKYSAMEAYRKWFLVFTLVPIAVYSIFFMDTINGIVFFCFGLSMSVLAAIFTSEFILLKLKEFNSLLIRVLAGETLISKESEYKIPDEINNQLVLVMDDKIRTLMNVQSAKYEAVAETTQFLAHDIRKPFSLAQMVLHSLSSAPDPESVRRIARQFFPDLTAALAMVDTMLQDVIDIGARPLALEKKDVNPTELLRKSVEECARIYPTSEINFNFEFGHRHYVRVDAVKFSRVISNILNNAMNILQHGGEIWIRSNEQLAENAVRLCLGNSGPVIPAEEIETIFEAFYSKGTYRGTGLGLAIARKIVTDHGGRIWCESSRENGTWFYISLPISEKTIEGSEQAEKLSAREIYANYLRNFAIENVSSSLHTDTQKRLEYNLEIASIRFARPLRVLMVEDESIYVDYLREMIAMDHLLQNRVEIVAPAIHDVESKAYLQLNFDAAICDIDLGISLGGLEVVRAIRDHASSVALCVYTNSISNELHQASVQAGADAFFPKPMSRDALLTFLALATRNLGEEKCGI